MMKTVAAKEAKNRFGQLIEETQRLNLNALRQGIEAACVQFDAGQEMPFSQAAVDRIKAAGRARLAERLAEQ